MNKLETRVGRLEGQAAAVPLDLPNRIYVCALSSVGQSDFNPGFAYLIDAACGTPQVVRQEGESVSAFVSRVDAYFPPSEGIEKVPDEVN